jgi:hypothetical protein
MKISFVQTLAIADRLKIPRELDSDPGKCSVEYQEILRKR